MSQKTEEIGVDLSQGTEKQKETLMEEARRRGMSFDDFCFALVMECADEIVRDAELKAAAGLKPYYSVH